jgi:hypothetical protein
MHESTNGSVVRSTLAISSWLPFGGIALLQAFTIVTGHYDPVKADFMPPPLLRYYYVQLGALIITSFAGMICVLLAPRAKTTFGYHPSLICAAICWGIQLAIWALLGLSIILTAMRGGLGCSATWA